VVIAIIALLVALLAPMLRQAKELAKLSVCLSNQRHLALGWAFYNNENEYIAQNYMEGGYWAQPMGAGPGLYSGFQAWMVFDAWPNYLANGGEHSRLSGIGKVFPYVEVPGIFYCPGTIRSREWLEDTWYERDSPVWGFGRQGTGTLTTYMYRSGMYDPDPTHGLSLDNLPTRKVWKRPDDEYIQNRAMLTCFWNGYVGSDSPNPAMATHGGKVTNVAFTDGHAATWVLPPEILPVWNSFCGESYSRGDFGQGWHEQLPWWWMEADLAHR